MNPARRPPFLRLTDLARWPGKTVSAICPGGRSHLSRTRSCSRGIIEIKLPERHRVHQALLGLVQRLSASPP